LNSDASLPTILVLMQSVDDMAGPVAAGMALRRLVWLVGYEHWGGPADELYQQQRRDFDGAILCGA